MFLLVVIGLFIISFLLALWSLRGMNRHDEAKKVTKELMRNRVLYQHETALTHKKTE